VNKNCVVIADFERELADGFEKRQTFDVAGSAADSVMMTSALVFSASAWMRFLISSVTCGMT